jgi:citrate lyase beta subunit
MTSPLSTERLAITRAALTQAHQEHARLYPGGSPRRQPVHTMYGGAHLFTAHTAQKMGQTALAALREYAPDARVLAACLDLDEALAERIHARVLAKLRHEPVEDFRIDFEDGYGHRSDEEEDGHATTAATEVARGLEEGTLPPFIGIRVKALTEELFDRSARTLGRFIGTLLERTGGKLPPGFVVTLPKVTLPQEVTALVRMLELLETDHGLEAGALKLELMVETPQALFTPDGRLALPALVAAAYGRCVAAHLGPYDYTASLHITAAQQGLVHPACDFARNVMQVSLAGSDVALADGPTNVLPVAPHKPGAHPLTEAQREENRQVVQRAWRWMSTNTRHALERGFYQGWDLHPAQLPVRYATVYSFFLEGLDLASRRLKSFVEQAARATRLGDVFDDAATGQGLLNSFLRGLACGAITEEEARATGLTLEELRGRSFSRILQGRRPPAE